MLPELRSLLAGTGLQIADEELLDALWLADRLPAGFSAFTRGPQHASDPARRPASSAAPASPRRRPRQGVDLFSAPAPPQRDAADPTPDRTGDTRPDTAVWAPGARALDNQLLISRALRPLKRRIASTTRTEFDIAATIDAQADTRTAEIVLRPQAERWMRLAMVVDAGMSMLLWERHCAELRAMFERSGAFRQLEVYEFRYGRTGTPIRLSRPGGEDLSTRHSDVLADPSGRTMIVVATDGSAEAWRDGRIRSLLHRWARKTPVAVLHMLPLRFWPGSGITAETWRVSTPWPGAANRAWRLEHPVLPPQAAVRDTVPIPVLNLTPAGLASWVGAMTNVGRSTAVRIWANAAADAPDATTGIRGRISVEDFSEAASTEALKLAAHLAAMAPLTVPVMQLVHASLAEDVGVTALAEVLLGGLIQPVPTQHLHAGASHQLYDFTARDKDLLLDAIPTEELIACSRRVGERIDRLIGNSGQFPAWTGKPANAATGARQQSRSFAHVGGSLLKRLGIPAVEPAPAVDQEPHRPDDEQPLAPPESGSAGTSNETPATRAANRARRTVTSSDAPVYFFLSYAHSSGLGPQDRFSRNALIQRFGQDLSNAVEERASHPRGIVPGLSDANIPLGGVWARHISDALSRCRTFVPLYAPEYFDSPDCGKEWSLFRHRLEANYIISGSPSEGIIPVLWLPTVLEAVPQAARQIQFTHMSLGREYDTRGLRYLMTHREYRRSYLRAVDILADRVVAVAEGDAPRALEPPQPYTGMPNAFDRDDLPPTVRPTVHIVIAAPREGRLPRGSDSAQYGPEPVHWKPYLPDYAGEIAQTARRLAESLGFRVQVESAEKSRALSAGRDPIAPTVLLVDPWATQDAQLAARLTSFDLRSSEKPWVRMVIVSSRAGAGGHELGSGLERTLGGTMARCRLQNPRAVAGLETVSELVNELPAVIRSAERFYLANVRIYPPAAPTPGVYPARPRLRGRAGPDSATRSDPGEDASGEPE